MRLLYVACFREVCFLATRSKHMLIERHVRHLRRDGSAQAFRSDTKVLCNFLNLKQSHNIQHTEKAVKLILTSRGMGLDSSSSICDEQKDDIVRRLAVLALAPLAPVMDVAPLRKDWETLSLVMLEPMLLKPSCSVAQSLLVVSL